MSSVILNAVDIDISDFGKDFNPCKLDFNNSEREGIRQPVLGDLKKVVHLSKQNLKRNTDGCLATKPHNNDSLLCPGGKRVQDDRFALYY